VAFRAAYLHKMGCGTLDFSGDVCWKKEDMSKAAENNSACLGSNLENKGNLQALSWEDEFFAGYCQCMLKKGYHRVDQADKDTSKICRQLPAGL
jgi:hypothetical protein